MSADRTTPQTPHDERQSADLSAGGPDRLGEYVLGAVLGAGGMGKVYAARHVKLDRPAAVKVILRETDQDVRRFLVEAAAVAAVRHPHVVEVYDCAEDAGRPYLAMEFLPGGSLADRLKRAGRLPPAEAVGLMAKVADGVQAAHAAGIVHRDLKPLNVLFDAADEPKVTDFGLAKRADADLTASQALVGTPAYMSPEQAAGRGRYVGPVADVWAIGVILYELLTGRRPFDGDEPLSVLTKIVADDPPRPRAVVRELPRDLELVVLKCLEKEPADRYVSAAELAAELRRLLAGEPVRVRPAGPVERAVKWVRRKPTLAAAYGLGVLAAVLVGAAVGMGWLYRQADEARGQLAVEKGETEQARDAAVGARREAEQARDGERQARQAEEAARRRLELVKYARDVGLAHREYLGNNIRRARQLLAGCPESARGWEWDYVHRLCHQDRLTLDTGRERVSHAAFSPDGRRVATAGSGVPPAVWDADTGERLAEFAGQPGGAYRVAFSPDGRRVVSCGNGVRVWAADTGVEMAHLPVPDADGGLRTSEFSPDGRRVVTATDDKVKVWEPDTGRVVWETDLGWHRLDAARFSPDGRFVVSDGAKNEVHVWSAADGKLLRTHLADEKQTPFDKLDQPQRLTAPSGNPGYFTRPHYARSACSPDGRELAVVGWDGQCRVYELASGRLLEKMAAKAGGWSETVEVEFSAGGETLAVTYSPYHCELYSRGSRKLIAGSLIGSIAPPGVRATAVSPDGLSLAAAREDRTIGLWETAHNPFNDGLDPTWAGNGRPRHILDHAESIYGIRFSPDSRRLLTWGRDGTARLWDVARPPTVSKFAGRLGQVNAVCLSPDFRRMLTTSVDGKDDWSARGVAVVWDIDTGRQVARFVSPGEGIGACDFSPDGRRVALGGWAGTTRVCEVDTGRTVHTLYTQEPLVRGPDRPRKTVFPDPPTPGWRKNRKRSDRPSLEEFGTPVEAPGTHPRIGSVEFAGRGQYVITAAADNASRVWDAHTGRPLANLAHGRWVSERAVASPDGRLVAVVRAYEDVSVFHTDTGRPLHTVTLRPGSGAKTVQFDPTGTRLLITGRAADGATVGIWDARTGEPIVVRNADGPQDPRAEFSPDGRRVAVSGNGYGPDILLWAAATGEVQTIVTSLSGDVHRLTFSPDGRRLAFTTRERAVVLADPDTGETVLSLATPDTDRGVPAFSPDGSRLLVFDAERVHQFNRTPLNRAFARPEPAPPPRRK